MRKINTARINTLALETRAHKLKKDNEDLPLKNKNNSVHKMLVQRIKVQSKLYSNMDRHATPREEMALKTRRDIVCMSKPIKVNNL